MISSRHLSTFEVGCVENSNDGTSDEESENDKAQELLILNEIKKMSKDMTTRSKDMTTRSKDMTKDMTTRSKDMTKDMTKRSKDSLTQLETINTQLQYLLLQNKRLQK